MNQICTDNFENKMKELRIYLFGDEYKLEKECIIEGINFNPDIHILKPDKLNIGLIEATVQIILRKAKLENEFRIIYGKLCESLIKIEIQLKGFDTKI